MFINLYPLRHGRCLTQVFSSCSFKEFKYLSQTSCLLPNILNQREPREFGSFFVRPSAAYFSSQLRPSQDDITINKEILSIKTIIELLELFDSIKSSVSVVNRVTMLYNIAKVTGRDGNQRRVLEQEKGKSRQGLNSAYLKLLGSISKDIAKCQPWDLANVM